MAQLLRRGAGSLRGMRAPINTVCTHAPTRSLGSCAALASAAPQRAWRPAVLQLYTPTRRHMATDVKEEEEDGEGEDGDDDEQSGPRGKATNVYHAIAHVQATFNNTIVNITDLNGNTLCWSSGGAAEGYRGTRKKTPFAGQLAAEKALTAAVAKGVRSLVVKVKGIGRGRETALRSLVTSEEVEVTAIEDVTPIPHNGCRPKKSRRL